MDGKNSMQGDLTQIKGIGEARSKWLQESLDINSVQELASQSADEIQEKLRSAGHRVAGSEIEAWVEQAQRIAAVNLGLEKPGSVPAPVHQGSDWKTTAQFFVDFQIRQSASAGQERRTKVHHMKDGREAVWPDFEGQRIGQWMLEQLEGFESNSSTSALPPETAVKSTTPAATTQSRHANSGMPPLSVKISEVWLSERAAQRPKITFAEPQKLPSAPLRGNTPFAMAISFTVMNPASVNQPGTLVTHQAQFYAYDRITGTHIHLGDSQSQQLLAGETHYTCQLPEATLPPGIYRLQTLVRIETSPPTIDFLEVPLLQVL